MAEYIRCRECDSLYCKGCNLKNLETMLCNGKFDCIMNENRCINTAADVVPVRHGRWECGKPCPVCGEDRFKGLDADIWADWEPHYCPNCGAKMDKQNEPEN